MYGFHLLKIGNLSAEINTESCAISHQVHVSLGGSPVQVKAEDNYIWVLVDDARRCVIVDPGEAAPVLQAIKENGWQPEAILLTHHHHDPFSFIACRTGAASPGSTMTHRRASSTKTQM